jgi:hypothetical protein
MPFLSGCMEYIINGREEIAREVYAYLLAYQEG